MNCAEKLLEPTIFFNSNQTNKQSNKQKKYKQENISKQPGPNTRILIFFHNLLFVLQKHFKMSTTVGILKCITRTNDIVFCSGQESIHVSYNFMKISNLMLL